jgi:enoyl-CoA hydratase/carnithine racemase
MDQELAAVCQAVEDDDDIEIGVLTGSADVFCEGLTLDAATAKDIRQQFGRLQGVEALAALTKPTLAALNGNAFGIGLELALGCDLRLAVSTAEFGLTQIIENLMPFGGGTQRLPRIVGQAKALEMILTGKKVDANEAHRIGLVSAVVAAADLSTRVDEVLSGLLGKGPVALRRGKEAVHKAMDLTLDQGIRLEEDLYVLLQTTQDRAEGVKSFLAKRKPNFTGR